MEDLRRTFVAEARELLEQLTLAALHVEREGGLSQEQRRHVLRVAHTLKGAARAMGEHRIADAAHAIEDLVAPEAGTGTTELAGRLLQQIDVIGADLGDGGQVETTRGEDAGTAPAEPAAEPARTVRVELAAIDAALERLADVSRRGMMLRDTAAADERRRGVQPAEIDRLLVAVAELRAQLHEFRLTPASTLFASTERALRDAAVASRVRARLDATGGQTRVDADLLDSVRDAVIQIVRNAIAHGIEPPRERAGAGKPPEGVVTLAVERRGSDIAFVIGDDGRGLDLAGLRRAAERGRALESDAGDERVIALLLEGGLSTQRSVSQLSGRGVGLEVVRRVVARYGGRVTLENRPGRGVTVTLLLPVTLRSLRYLRLESGAAAALLPLDAVRRISRVADLPSLVSGDRLHVVVDDEPVPRLSLSSVLSRTEPVEDRVAAVVSAGGRTVALTAERFGEVGTTIAQALPPLSGASEVVSGLALDDVGGIVPVLEPDALNVRLASAAAAPAAAARRPRLLVIDDSITTRTLEQSILEGAGYLVDTAASAEEALERAGAVAYDLFIVDVEMPGMNGFDFVAVTRADPALAGTPAMLVTSRAADEDRRRGLELGAGAYIVKSEFDQDTFLDAVRGLVG